MHKMSQSRDWASRPRIVESGVASRGFEPRLGSPSQSFLEAKSHESTEQYCRDIELRWRVFAQVSCLPWLRYSLCWEAHGFRGVKVLSERCVAQGTTAPELPLNNP